MIQNQIGSKLFGFAPNNSLATKIKKIKWDTWHKIKLQLKFNIESN